MTRKGRQRIADGRMINPQPVSRPKRIAQLTQSDIGILLGQFDKKCMMGRELAFAPFRSARCLFEATALRDLAPQTRSRCSRNQ